MAYLPNEYVVITPINQKPYMSINFLHHNGTSLNGHGYIRQNICFMCTLDFILVTYHPLTKDIYRRLVF
jgi:hypothetical protein